MCMCVLALVLGLCRRLDETKARGGGGGGGDGGGYSRQSSLLTKKGGLLFKALGGLPWVHASSARGRSWPSISLHRRRAWWQLQCVVAVAMRVEELPPDKLSPREEQRLLLPALALLTVGGEVVFGAIETKLPPGAPVVPSRAQSTSPPQPLTLARALLYQAWQAGHPRHPGECAAAATI